MKIHPRSLVHIVSVAVSHSPMIPVPFAQEGTVMAMTRVRAEWHQLDDFPWRLKLVTVRGAANNGSGVTVDYFPDNPAKQPPAELSEWLASTHPGRVNEEASA